MSTPPPAALLLKPGFLTREFIDGRRVSYLPPIRLYLVLSVLFFLLASATPAPMLMVGVQRPDNGPTRMVISPIVAASKGESVAQRQARVCGRIEFRQRPPDGGGDGFVQCAVAVA